jgi:uncharacterized protein (TIGR00156 family)
MVKVHNRTKQEVIMGKHRFYPGKSGVLALALAVLAPVLYGQEGFSGPGSSANRTRLQPISVSVLEAKGLQSDTPVLIRGRILRALGDEKYEFQDSQGGSITIKIDQWVWRGLAVTPSDSLEIRGETERRRNTVEIDVKEVKKL